MRTHTSLDDSPDYQLLDTFTSNPPPSDGLGGDCPTAQIHQLVARAYEAQDDAVAQQLEAEASALEPCDPETCPACAQRLDGSLRCLDHLAAINGRIEPALAEVPDGTEIRIERWANRYLDEWRHEVTTGTLQTEWSGVRYVHPWESPYEGDRARILSIMAAGHVLYASAGPA